MTSTFKLLLLFFITAVVSCSPKHDLIVNCTNPEIQYWGRIDTTKTDAAELYWSGTSILLNFEGSAVSAMFDEERGDNYYNVIIDNDSLFVFHPDTVQHSYTLAEGLSEGPHQIEIFKRTEWDRGWSRFYGFKIEGASKVLPKPPSKKRKIEFYGNSITAGYAVDDFSGRDRSDSIFTNNYLSYAKLTADHFDAEYRCICKSGIGITISWFPLIMPELYNRLDPADPESRWDFSRYSPDLVVINLFQNDSWLVENPRHDEFKRQFGTEKPTDEFIIEKYADFVRSIRKEYPSTPIICMLGNMDATREGSRWPGLVEAAVKRVGDSEIYTFFEPYKNSPGHPTIAEQQTMAKHLSAFIEENINW
ncbi:SGNH/GDSL hydrolase family protein [Maribellus sediminis]|uniref:SGNH/GDSL hydrolase family protein n=1 Tax=Maribellus sediminis TaxID=2696285 RepID=UPI001431757E|nr:SGNH/GDSL hydrolase family protein [Maribellus sediminis]